MQGRLSHKRRRTTRIATKITYKDLSLRAMSRTAVRQGLTLLQSRVTKSLPPSLHNQTLERINQPLCSASTCPITAWTTPRTNTYDCRTSQGFRLVLALTSATKRPRLRTHQGLCTTTHNTLRRQIARAQGSSQVHLRRRFTLLSTQEKIPSKTKAAMPVRSAILVHPSPVPGLQIKYSRQKAQRPMKHRKILPPHTPKPPRSSNNKFGLRLLATCSRLGLSSSGKR